MRVLIGVQWTLITARVFGRDAHPLERQSRCVTIAGRGYRAISACASVGLIPVTLGLVQMGCSVALPAWLVYSEPLPVYWSPGGCGGRVRLMAFAAGSRLLRLRVVDVSVWFWMVCWTRCAAGAPMRL